MLVFISLLLVFFFYEKNIQKSLCMLQSANNKLSFIAFAVVSYICKYFFYVNDFACALSFICQTKKFICNFYVNLVLVRILFALPVSVTFCGDDIADFFLCVCKCVCHRLAVCGIVRIRVST